MYSGGQLEESSGEDKYKKHKCRNLSLKIKFAESVFKESFSHTVNTAKNVATLKSDLEIITGIPTPLQQLCLFDEAYLYDTTPLYELNLVKDCTFNLTVRHDWMKLVEAVLQQDFQKVILLSLLLGL